MEKGEITRREGIFYLREDSMQRDFLYPEDNEKAGLSESWKFVQVAEDYSEGL